MNLNSQYVLLTGQGRSGTNWLLDLFNIHPLTYCRNEADQLQSGPLCKLPTGIACQPLGEDFEREWDQAVLETSFRMGDRDRIGVYPKSYLSNHRRIIGKLLLGKPRLRKTISIVNSDLNHHDWEVPQWFANHSKLEKSLPVIKINQVPGWIEWILKNRPQGFVVHIVRHPGGFLNSWINRYVNRFNYGEIKTANAERLEIISHLDSEWKNRFDDIQSMTAEESELWYWLYANEMIFRAGQGQDNYLLIIYEELANEPLKLVNSIYSKCRLFCTPELEDKIALQAISSPSIATKWRSKLSSQQIKLVKKILSQTFMAKWW